jgi:hypothetical protein
MSYDSKIDAARQVLDCYNDSLNSEENEFKVDFDSFLKNLRKKGGTTEAALKSCSSYESLEACGAPEAQAREIANIFRGKRTSTEDSTSYIGSSKAKRMTPNQLVDTYDPKEPESSVAKRLKEMASNKPFVVFTQDGRVNTDATKLLLQELRDGFEPREFYGSGLEVSRVYGIGDRPDRLADQNPLFTGEVLRPDGTCSQTNRSWSNVSTKVRKLIYVARTKTNEIQINSVQDAHAILDLVVADNAEEKIAQRCQEAVAVLAELEQLGEAPTLRVPLNGAGASRLSDPFHGAGSAHSRS